MSSRDQIIQSLRRELPALQAEFGVRSLSLFGSVARGDDTPESDVDVLVEFDPTRRVTLLTLAGLRGRLADLLGREVDVGTAGGLRPRMRQDVEREALRVA